MTDLPDFEKRSFIIAGLGGLGFFALAGRMAQLQIFEYEEFRVEAADNQFNYSVIPASRGPIYDRFGIPLAVNRRDFRVIIISAEAGNKKEGTKIIEDVSKVLKLDDASIKKAKDDLMSQPKFMPTQIASNLSWEDFSRISLYSINFPGIRPEMGESRNYPLGEAFSHVIGYVGKANAKDLEKDPSAKHPAIRVGKQGLEKQEEAFLKGKHGAQKVEVDAHGRIIRQLNDANLAPKPGSPIVLTVDAEIQQLAYDSMKEESGTIIVMDVNTGDIIAFVSAPGFDPNKFVNGISSIDYKNYSDNPKKPLYNKATRGNYPAASTFKPLVSIAALEAGVLTPEEHIYCSGVIEIGGTKFHCASRRGHGSINLHSAIKASCDVFFYEVGRRLGGDKIAEVARRFGYGSLYDIGIPSISKGVVPDEAWKLKRFKKPWAIYDTINMSIGQGYVQITPLQLCVAASRIASGKVVMPRLVKYGPAAKPVEQFKNLGVSEEHLKIIHDGMKAVTTEPGGTAVAPFGIPGVAMAGKTGTAQVRQITLAERKKGVKSNASLQWELRDHSLFMSFAPADAPKYACAVIIEHGGFGAGAAAPRAREVLKATLLKDPSKLQSFEPKLNEQDLELRARQNEIQKQMPSIEDKAGDKESEK